METVIVLGDLQIPYHDPPTVKAVLDYITKTKPDMVVVIGDFLDFPSLTTKFLRARTDPQKLLDEIWEAASLLDIMRLSTKRLVFIEGNHEARLHNYITEKAPDLEALAGAGGPLDLKSLLGVKPMEYVGPYGSAFIHKGFVFKHGDIASHYSAFRELQMEGSSGMSGHTHRFQTAMHTDRSGAHAWYSIGCLCKIKGEGMPPPVEAGLNRMRNWQQGFAEIHFSDGIFNVYPIVITNGRFVAP